MKTYEMAAASIPDVLELLKKTQQALENKKARCLKLSAEKERRKAHAAVSLQSLADAHEYGNALGVVLQKERKRTVQSRAEEELRNTYQPMRTALSTSQRPFVRKKSASNPRRSYELRSR